MGMRRQDREIRDLGQLHAVLAAARVCRLGLNDGEWPYVVPVSFGWEPGRIFFHGALTGHKQDLLERDPRVCCEFEADVRLVTDPERACRWTFAYRSVIARGRAERLTDAAAVRHGLGCIMRQYSGGSWSFPDEQLERVVVWRVDLETITGKESLQKPPPPASETT
ncbi:MAG: pyridoxamine 5'-phosphate oxidase family protein [Candidatus Krumholzibacteriia bacterium]